MSNFKIGDRVCVIRHQQDCPIGLTGTVISTEFHSSLAIRLDTRQRWAHTCEGRIPHGYGYWLDTRNITKTAPAENHNPYESVINKIKYLDQRFKDRKENYVQDW